MTKKFTINDVQSVTKLCHVMGVEQYWCHILFKGCVNPHPFHAHPRSEDEFARDMYERIGKGEFGEVRHGTGEWYITQPAEQSEVEAKVIAKRNQLLLESDYTEFPTRRSTMSSETVAAWDKYRQDLRDLTKQPQFPWDPVWPERP